MLSPNIGRRPEGTMPIALPASSIAPFFAGRTPAVQQIQRALAVAVPGSVASGEIGGHHKSISAYRYDIVHDRSHRIARDIGEPAYACRIQVIRRDD
jgi:hypothetical protein